MKLSTEENLSLRISPDELVARLLAMPEEFGVCILDSCGVGEKGSNRMIAGILPVKTVEFSGDDPAETLKLFEKKLTGPHAAVFTLSYDLGRKLCKGPTGTQATHEPGQEPDFFLALFQCLIVYDYETHSTAICGYEKACGEIGALLGTSKSSCKQDVCTPVGAFASNFTRREYCAAVETIKEYIRRGDTYQANLTQQLRVNLDGQISPENIFLHLRKSHPAPFSSFIRRKDSIVVSISPERFFRIEGRKITVSPIKGTRPRGRNHAEDAELKSELLTSEKDRAENIMIVDLLRNDIGRVCEYGTVRVEKLCALEQHPTLFHLVSTITGRLRPYVGTAEIIRAVFPCGSITGAPKIRTMQILDEIETASRGLSMGAIGYYIPDDVRQAVSLSRQTDSLPYIDLSVAIRTMTIKNGEAVFNVGGGVVIDSDPAKEYEESILKAQALLAAMNAEARN